MPIEKALEAFRGKNCERREHLLSTPLPHAALEILAKAATYEKRLEVRTLEKRR